MSYKTIHYCENNGVAHTVLHNADTGIVITTDVPMLLMPYIGHPEKTPKVRNR